MTPDLTTDEARFLLLVFMAIGLIGFGLACWGAERLQDWWADRRGERKWWQ